jgi:hypothetical protein
LHATIFDLTSSIVVAFIIGPVRAEKEVVATLLGCLAGAIRQLREVVERQAFKPIYCHLVICVHNAKTVHQEAI